VHPAFKGDNHNTMEWIFIAMSLVSDVIIGKSPFDEKFTSDFVLAKQTI